MRTVLIFPEPGDESVLELTAAARALGEVKLVQGAIDQETPDGDLSARRAHPLVAQVGADVVLVPHTNLGLDFAPVLAGLCDATLVTDCIGLEAVEGGLRVIRTLYGGKVHARLRVSGQRIVATVRPGAFATGSDAPDETVPATAEVAARRRFVETVAPEPGAVDITQADLLVAVGRGIEEQENLEIVEALAEALGAEVACTRPVVDKGWLPKSRQVGTSGVTVKPKVYLAIGVSGSFQHMGGVKGGPFVAAINKDPAAPIFGVADIGVVGDLFDLVPLLEEKIRERKG